MHPPGTPARSAPLPASRRPTLARAWSLLGLLVLALWCGSVAAGGALSPAAGSAGSATLTAVVLIESGPAPPPQDFAGSHDLFGKRRIPRGGDWTPAPPIVLPPAHHQAPSTPASAVAFERDHRAHSRHDATPARDHRRLLTERYPPQAPPLA